VIFPYRHCENQNLQARSSRQLFFHVHTGAGRTNKISLLERRFFRVSTAKVGTWQIRTGKAVRLRPCAKKVSLSCRRDIAFL
jgi:hypothetical protein